MEDEIENALNLVVSTTEQSSNMRKTLNENIYETVSTLRQLFAKIKISSECERSEIKDLTNKVSKLEDELQSCREKLDKAQQTPSIDNTAEQKDRRPGLQEPTSVGLTPKITVGGAQSVALHSGNRRPGLPEPTSIGSTPKVTGERTQGVAPPSGNMNRPYASVVKESKPKKYKLTVKARSALPTEEIKQLLKTKVNPGEKKWELAQ